MSDPNGKRASRLSLKRPRNEDGASTSADVREPRTPPRQIASPVTVCPPAPARVNAPARVLAPAEPAPAEPAIVCPPASAWPFAPTRPLPFSPAPATVARDEDDEEEDPELGYGFMASIVRNRYLEDNNFCPIPKYNVKHMITVPSIVGPVTYRYHPCLSYPPRHPWSLAFDFEKKQYFFLLYDFEDNHIVLDKYVYVNMNKIFG